MTSEIQSIPPVPSVIQFLDTFVRSNGGKEVSHAVMHRILYNHGCVDDTLIQPFRKKFQKADWTVRLGGFNLELDVMHALVWCAVENNENHYPRMQAALMVLSCTHLSLPVILIEIGNVLVAEAESRTRTPPFILNACMAFLARNLGGGGKLYFDPSDIFHLSTTLMRSYLCDPVYSRCALSLLIEIGCLYGITERGGQQCTELFNSEEMARARVRALENMLLEDFAYSDPAFERSRIDWTRMRIHFLGEFRSPEIEQRHLRISIDSGMHDSPRRRVNSRPGEFNICFSGLNRYYVCPDLLRIVTLMLIAMEKSNGPIKMFGKDNMRLLAKALYN